MCKWKVLIADDESIIRDGIRSSVDWEKFDMEVVGEAEDGEEAVELAIKHQIDILLIDLNMPIMNGITAMKKLKEKLPDCKLLVISGYDEFSYAQEAIRLQVEDYVLKPINPEKLQNLLIELKQKLDMEVNQETYFKRATNQIKKHHVQLKGRFFRDWIEGQLAKEEIEEQLQFFGLPASVPLQHMVVRWPEYHQNQTVSQENDRRNFLFAIENIVEEILGSEKLAVFRDQTNLLNVCLWKKVTNEQIEIIEETIKNYLKITVYWYVEDVTADDLTNYYKVYDWCKTQVDKQVRISPIVKQAKNYVEEHYQDSALKLERVAEELHVSTVYLSRMIKQELGISYVGLLTQMRINKAADLLKTTDMTIRDIAEEVGYETQHYFSTAFKKVVGISPNQFKK
ncbi:response regulator transcription factor [Aquibacillus rhizosphaerae]|uniref:Response regulator n=1 Tax=Aquibacillus rhizosphaerae TaxID=3051431 RepID=A0ABT7L4V1_9BACI|nr:response regulator [Aquibacillus sp. LR5S19]MDL4840896.1 response regulator [Aquibacillus sp. LR5S19]